MTQRYILEITPAVEPEVRHKIEKLFEDEGFRVLGGGQMVDMSKSDITFTGEEDAES